MNYLTIALAILAVSYMRSYDAGNEPAKQEGIEWHFRAGKLLRWVVIGGFGWLFLLGLRTLATNEYTDQLFGVVFALAALPFYLFVLPRTISFSPLGLTWRGWFYRRRFVPWTDVTRAAKSPGMKQVLIYMNNGCVISHTRYHTGRRQLLKLLEKHRIAVT